MLYVLDEPSIGLHPSNIVGLTGVMHDLIADGNSVILVDHDTQILKSTFLKSVNIWDTPSTSRHESTSRTRKAIMSRRTNGQFSRIPMSLSLIHI